MFGSIAEKLIVVTFILPGPSIAYLLKPGAMHPFVTPLVHPAVDLYLLQATCAVFQFVMNR